MQNVKEKTHGFERNPFVRKVKECMKFMNYIFQVSAKVPFVFEVYHLYTGHFSDK